MKTALVRAACLVTLAFSLELPTSASAADDVWSIERLNADSEKWTDKIDLPMKVEGRVSAVSKFQFRFVHCELTFHVTEDQSRTVGNVRNVEVSGRFKKDKATGKLIFAVDRVKVLPSDLEQFESKEVQLKSTRADDWYELAEWAASRGRFYGDQELAGKARRAWVKGIQLEHKALLEGDAEARFALAKRIGEMELDERLAADLIHEGARLNWQQAKNDPERWKAFADWLTKTYPGSMKRLESIPIDLDRRYAARPVETFREADDRTRDVLKRLFFIQVELARILPLAKEDGSNASAIADALSDRVPERTELIETYRESAFNYRLKSIASASRTEALRLASELNDRQQPDRSRELLSNWIRSREDRLKKDGPIGLMQLAEDYLQLVEDERAAVALLAEAHRQDPSFIDPSERLKQLGYHLDQDRWIKGDAREAAMTPSKDHGQLAIGMTSDDVRSLLGIPNAKSRVLTAAGTQEVWSFGRRGAPRLLIHLSRTSASEPLKVARFLTAN